MAYKKSRSYLEEKDCEPIFVILDSIGVLISDYINGLKIDDLSDLNIVSYKLKYIQGLISDRLFRFPYSVRDILDDFKSLNWSHSLEDVDLKSLLL